MVCRQNGRREKFPGEKTHAVGVGGRRGAEKPRNGLCIWNKERIMDVVLYKEHVMNVDRNRQEMNLGRNAQWIWRETSNEKD